MIPDQVIVTFLMGLGSVAIWRHLKAAWPLWKTHSHFGDDEELADRVVQVLKKLPDGEGFYSSERHISSRRLIRELSPDGEIPQLQQRLALLVHRGILEFHYDQSQGAGPEGRLYRLRRSRKRRVP